MSKRFGQDDENPDIYEKHGVRSVNKIPWHIDAVEIDADKHVWTNYMFDANGDPVDLKDSATVRLIVDSVNAYANGGNSVSVGDDECCEEP